MWDMKQSVNSRFHRGDRARGRETLYRMGVTGCWS